MVESQLYLNVVKLNVVHSSNSKFYDFIVKPFVRKKSHMSFRSIINIEKETKTKIENDPIVIKLEKKLQCTKSEAISVYVYFTKNAIQMDLEKMNKIVKWLHGLGAEISIISENCHLFLVPLSKIHILIRFNTFLFINIALPIHRILEKIVHDLESMRMEALH